MRFEDQMILLDRFYNDDSHWSSRLLILYSHVLKKRGHLAAASMMNSVIGLLVPDHVKLKEWFNHPKKILPLFRLLTLSCCSKPVCFNFSVSLFSNSAIIHVDCMHKNPCITN